MSKRTKTLCALLVPFALAVAACGGDDDDDAGGDDAPAATDAPDAGDDGGDDAPEATDPPADEPETTDPPAPEATDPPPPEPETDEIVEAFDANGDGTITMGVAAAGPRDDGGYVESVVNFAESFSAENGFAPPIIRDNVGADDAAQAMSDLAQQGIDIMIVGASEIAEPLADLTEQFPDIFWYCNCGAGFAELPGLAQATDWGAAIHYTAGVAMAQTLLEQGGTKAVFLGCCDLNFEQEAFNATLFGMASVDPTLTMEYVSTGDFVFDFANSANATAALTAAIADGATLAYAYLDGALEPVAQASSDAGIAVFAAAPADICSRDDGINWTGSIVFDGGSYAAQAMRLIVAGELQEGETYQFPTEQGLNGAEICAPSAEAESAVADAFGLLASFDGDLMGALGGISGEAYAGG